MLTDAIFMATPAKCLSPLKPGVIASLTNHELEVTCSCIGQKYQLALEAEHLKKAFKSSIVDSIFHCNRNLVY